MFLGLRLDIDQASTIDRQHVTGDVGRVAYQEEYGPGDVGRVTALLERSAVDDIQVL